MISLQNDNNNNILLYVLYFQSGADRPLQGKEPEHSQTHMSAHTSFLNLISLGRA